MITTVTIKEETLIKLIRGESCVLKSGSNSLIVKLDDSISDNKICEAAEQNLLEYFGLEEIEEEIVSTIKRQEGWPHK